MILHKQALMETSTLETIILEVQLLEFMLMQIYHSVINLLLDPSAIHGCLINQFKDFWKDLLKHLNTLRKLISHKMLLLNEFLGQLQQSVIQPNNYEILADLELMAVCH